MKSKRAQEAVAAAEDKPADIHGDATPPTKKRKRGGDDDGDAVEDSGKKAKKDKKKKKGEKESRKEKKEKRKDLQDLPEEDNDSDADDAAANGDVSAVAEEKKSKKEKKEKKDKKKSSSDATDADANGETEAPKKKSKKDKKDKTSVTAEEAIPNGADNGIDLDVDEEDADEEEAEGGDAKPEKEKKTRHIVFVGNLPFTATAASISAHFASLSPIAVRCLTNKGDTKNTCKGIAFVEFANVWTQRTCLERFHHSMFEDGQSAARKINVELSAGGGGTGDNRKEKIREKNRKLDENRAKRIEKEKVAKAESGTTEEQQEHMDEQIHPSRRAQMGNDAPEDDFNNNGYNGGSGGGGGRRGGWGGRGRGGGGGGRGRGGRGGRGGGRGRGSNWSR